MSSINRRLSPSRTVRNIGAIVKNNVSTILSAECLGVLTLPFTNPLTCPGSPLPGPDFSIKDSVDAILDVAGGEDFTSIDASILTNNKTIYVVQGTYDEDVTLDFEGIHLILGPGTIIDDGVSGNGTLTITANNCTVELLPGVVIDGLVTWQGNGGTLKMGAGSRLGGGLNWSGIEGSVVGCGKSTKIQTLFTVSGVDTILENLSVTAVGTITNTIVMNRVEFTQDLTISGVDGVVSCCSFNVLTLNMDTIKLSSSRFDAPSDSNTLVVVGDENQIITNTFDDHTGFNIDIQATADNTMVQSCQISSSGSGSIQDNGTNSVNIDNQEFNF